MENRQSLVAFIDILGFQNHVSDYFSGNDTSKLLKLENALKEADEFAIRISQNYLKHHNIEQSVKQFSDCVSISIPVDPKDDIKFLNSFGALINIVRLYQFILLEQEILVRGGISMGSHYESNRMIFSEGLINAYKLESEKAMYPRIILSKELTDFVLHKIKPLEKQDIESYKQLFLDNILEDWDNELFLNPFGQTREFEFLIENHIEFLMDALSKASNTKVDSELLKTLNLKSDLYYAQNALQLASEYIKEHPHESSNVLLKYKWLANFAMWNIDEDVSRIRFKRYFDSDESNEGI